MIQSRASTPESGQNNYRDLLQNATMQIRSLRSELDDLRRQQTEPIAIIGMACRFPGGANTPEAYWELLRNGVDAISEIPSQRWDVAAHYDPDADVPGKMYTRHAGFIDRVDQFDPQFFGISPREAHSLDPQQRLLLEVGYTALENAGQPPFDLRGTRTGVFVGVSFDDYAQLSVRSGDLTRIDAYSSLGNTRSIAAGRLSYTFGFQGPTMQLDTTCSSSLLAIHLACQSLRSGESNLALAGGVNLMLSPEPTIGFCKLKALAPDGRCKTFDAAADGYGRGEGCGIVVLKRLSDAIANQDPILAVLRGSAVNHDGLSNGLTAPNGAAQEAVLRQALDNANVEPEQVQYVEVHGTGTRLGDPIEVLALDKIMGQRSNPLLVGSVKTNIGHLESAAGVASLIKVILALQHQQIPPHLHLQTPNPYIPWDKLAVEVPTQLTPWTAHEDPRLAGISSFGMSGTNVHLILEEAPLPTDSLNSFLSWQDRENIRDRPLHLLPLSARSEDALRELVKRYQDWLDGCEDVVLPDVCFAAGVGRSHFNHRVAFLAADLPQLCQQLSSFLSETPTPGILAPPSTTPRRKIAFLFTGQGSQYPGMGRHLYEHEPAFRRAIDDCAEILAGEGINLLELMYGEVRSQESGARSQESGVREQELGARSQEPGANNEERRTKNEQLITNNEQPIQNSRYPSGSRSGVYKTQNSSSEFRGALLFPQGTPNSELRIHQTQFAQPTLFALEYALAQLWLSWGIEPDGVMGHSIGEYVAACVAGVFSLEDGLRLVAARGRLMQALPAGGGMVAVMASVEQVAKLLPKGISVAAINGPEATVISGDLTVLADVVAVLERDGIKHKALPVSHAFHSELMEPLLAAFKTVTDVVAYAPPQIELIANITGQVVECVDADYWVRHVRQPVQFAAGMNTLATEGYDTFIEIGPKPTLLAMGRTSVSQSGIEVEPEALWLPSVRPDADWLTLLTSLGQLYASGATIDWAGFDQSYPRQMVQLPNYPFQNQRYWVDIDTQEKARYVAPSQPHPLIHPLLGSPLPLAGDQVRYFEVQLRQDLPGYLQDHQVFGEVLFPAAGYLEIAIAAARSCLPDQSNPLVLCDVSLPKGLLLPSEETVVVQTVVTRSRSEDLGSEYGFEIFSQRQSAEASWQCHGRGAIAIATNSRLPDPVDIEAKQGALSSVMTAIAFYDAYAQRGINYGLAFCVVEQVWQGSREALAHIGLSSTQLMELQDYQIHPVILDASLQVAGATLELQTTSVTYLPVGIERLSRFQADADIPAWVYAQRRESAASAPDAADSRIPLIDVKILTATGQAIAILEGLKLQPVSPERLLGTSSSRGDMAEEAWLYQVAWQSQPLPPSNLAIDCLLAPDVIREQVAPAFTHLISQPAFADYQGLMPQFEALSLSYVIQAFGDLGWSPQPGETFTEQELAVQLAVVSKYQRLFHRCLQMLAKERILQQYGRHWELVEPLPVPEIASSPDLLAEYPVAATELRLLSRCGENLASVLKGQLDPLTLLFPEGDLGDLTRFYEESPGARVFNKLVQQSVAVTIAQSRHPIRILEIGAGTGGTTAHLLSCLSDAKRTVEYVFTDISPLFLSRARERFQSYSFVQYELLDIERSPVEQGFHQSFDLIIAANVLHATADLTQTLAHVYELLVPGGELILLEGTETVRWLDLIFGLTEGWWRFTDQALRSDYPLLSVNQWLHLLAANGFTAAVLESDDLGKQRLPQSVIVAQRDVSSPRLSTAAAEWLILADTLDLSGQVRKLLSQKGQSAVVVYADVITSAVSDWRQGDRTLDWEANNLAGQLLQILQVEYPWQGIVYLTESLEQDSVSNAAMKICRRGLHLVQGILNANLTPAPRLYFVTQGATGLATTELGLGQSPLWGFAKTVALEHPEFRCTCLDMGPADAELLVAELLVDSPEQQVAWLQQQRHVARLQPYAVVGPSEAHLAIAEQSNTESQTRLVIAEPGTLTNLTLQPTSLQAPAADEVAIQVSATGLNFRDILTAMGQYPGEPMLGCECAGVIVNVGDRVQDLAVGQRVVGIAPHSFSQTVTVNRAMVIPIPDNMDLEAAATIPVAFLTAYYSLVELASLQPGERVLIHVATGGVGQAAIQIAQNIGAEIIATASPGKWDVLRAIGVKHIFNSRTLDFADEVMAFTQGAGVDVVLNSLPGEFRQKSIEVLRQSRDGFHGRFVELGLDTLAAPFPKNYFPINLPALCQEQPELIQSMLQDLVRQFASGTLQPLPQTIFPFTEVTQAFRTMQRAQHVGKLVVVQDREQGAWNREQGAGNKEQGTGRSQESGVRRRIPNSEFQIPNSLRHAPITQLFPPDATYLITGGTGGLGLQVADWMIRRGSKHLVLVSRRSPTAEVQEQIRGLTSQGGKVETVQADVSDRHAMTSVLYRIAASPYPLRGVVHAAGVLCDGPLEQLSWSQFESVLVPKVQGAWNLHQLTRDLPLDFFVLFSSAASLLGTPGQANHAAANAFLDALAQYRQAQGLPGLSLNWGAWSEVGSALRYQQGDTLTGLAGVGLITPAKGLAQLEQLWSQPIAQLGVVPIQWSTFLRQGNLRQAPFLEAFHQEYVSPKASVEQQTDFRQRLAATPEEEQRHLLDTHVCGLISQILGFAPEDLDRQKGFFDLGLDSLTAMELKNSLQASLGCSLPSTLAFDYPTVDRLLDYLAEQLLTDKTPDFPNREASELAMEELPDEADLAAQLDQKLADLEDLMD